MPSVPGPPLLAVPIILTILVIPLSLAYRYSVSKGSHRRLTKFYAFVTETIQLLLAGIGLTNTIAIIHALWTDCQQPSELSNILLAVMMLLIVLAGTVFSIYAVDLIEARIQLGIWGHPYKWQCFVLTRSLLMALRYTGKPRNRQQAVKARPHFDAMFKSMVSSDFLNLESLDYLDLAYDQRSIRTTDWVLTKTGGMMTRRHSWL